MYSIDQRGAKQVKGEGNSVDKYWRTRGWNI